MKYVMKAWQMPKSLTIRESVVRSGELTAA